MRITYSVCVCVFVALGVQRAMRMSHIRLSSVACPVVQNFPRYLINGEIFEKSLLKT